MTAPNKVVSRSMVPVYTKANDTNMLFRYKGPIRNGKYLDDSGNGNDSLSHLYVNAGENKSVQFSGPVTATVKGSILGSVLNPTSASHTMAGFVRLVIPAVTFNATVLGKDANAAAFSLPGSGGIYIDSTGASAAVWYDGGAYRETTPAFTINEKLRYHMAYVLDYATNCGYHYIDGILRGSYSPLVVANAFTTTGYNLGYLNSSSAASIAMKGSIKDGTLWSQALSAADIRKEWLQYAQMVQMKTGWGVKQSVANENTVGAFVGQGSSPFEIRSGTWKISTQTVDGELHKVLECVAAGTCWLDRRFLAINNAEAAYGSWRGLMYHAPSATPTLLAVTASAVGAPSAVNGYVLRYYNTEARVTRYAAGVYTDIATLPSPGAATALAEFQVQRRFDNNWRFSGRLVPTAYGTPDWTPWQTSGYVSEATYTTSEGMSFTANAGDWLSLGTVRGNYALTKFLGEFAPTEV